MKQGKPYVVCWRNEPRPEWVGLFNLLADRGKYDFVALLNNRSIPNWGWNYENMNWTFFRNIDSICIRGLKLKYPGHLLSGRVPDVMVTEYAKPLFVIGFFLAKMRGVKTVCYVEKTSDSWVQRIWWKQVLKRIMFHLSDGIFTTGNDGVRFAIKAGADPDKIYEVPFLCDIEMIKGLKDGAIARREDVRRTRAIQGVVFLYVGRMNFGNTKDPKGLYLLLDAYKQAHTAIGAPTTLLMVGEGRDKKKLMQKCQNANIENVIFTGFMEGKELYEMYYASDVFVFPSLGDSYGSVVNEAMAANMPVIASDAVGEISDRIEDGVNGFIIPSGDCGALAGKMMTLALDENLRKEMGRKSGEKISSETTEKFASLFENAVDGILAGK